MVFFNVSPDPDGSLQFRVSDRWWYFLAATVPTTLAVFAVWIVWQKIRLRNSQEGYNLTEHGEKVVGSAHAALDEDSEEIFNVRRDTTPGKIWKKNIFRKRKISLLL